MGDWADYIEAGGRDYNFPERFGKRKKPGRASVSFTMSKEQKRKYIALGGADWVRKMVDAAALPEAP